MERGEVVGLANRGIAGATGRSTRSPIAPHPSAARQGGSLASFWFSRTSPRNTGCWKAVRDSEEMYRTAFLTIPAAVAVARLADGKHIGSTKVSTRIWMGAREIIGMNRQLVSSGRPPGVQKSKRFNRPVTA